LLTASGVGRKDPTPAFRNRSASFAPHPVVVTIEPEGINGGFDHSRRLLVSAEIATIERISVEIRDARFVRRVAAL
jgi:hypothetical protein